MFFATWVPVFCFGRGGGGLEFNYYKSFKPLIEIVVVVVVVVAVVVSYWFWILDWFLYFWKSSDSLVPETSTNQEMAKLNVGWWTKSSLMKHWCLTFSIQSTVVGFLVPSTGLCFLTGFAKLRESWVRKSGWQFVAELVHQPPICS